MASNSFPYLYLFLIITCLLLFTTANPVLGFYKSIFSFGDSLADTGNVLFSSPDEYVGKLPYGETYFHQATVAKSVGLPLLPRYLASSGKDLRQGVNFSVGGATALDASFFEERKVSVPKNASLKIQLKWFRELLPSLCIPSSSTLAFFLLFYFEVDINFQRLNPSFLSRELKSKLTN
ncbi:hypothetical protein C5167_008928 [Papaver somniferum]|uniref:GDSL esterase/lipase n=1 Tax=Papaver somniferum TaxID=3469 RepID=A0A4Y7JZX0_PAPSO|nr:hypothetical protein C5167_008928 [Papaver somniferum]